MMAKTNPFTFMQEVRQEVSKVVWPTRRETTVTTIMVFIMVFLAAIFFLLADQALASSSASCSLSAAREARTHGIAVVHRSRLLEFREKGGRVDP
jgi:preprotein translocase subunit SecE